MSPWRLTVLALGLALPIGQARADNPTQWSCQADTDGRWQCRSVPVSSGPYRLPSRPTVAEPDTAAGTDTETATRAADTATAKTATVPAPAELDWVTRADMTPEQRTRTPTYCGGAYLEPPNDNPEAGLDPEQAPLRLSAENSELRQQSIAVLEGNVRFAQGSRRGRADRAVLYREEDRLTLDGDIALRDPGLLLRGSHGELNLGDGTGTLDDAWFVAHADHYRGHTEQLARTAPGIMELTRSSYTTCAPGDNFWSLRARHVELDRNTGTGTAQHAVLALKDVPVAYVPYLQFPIDDRRKTGFLWPSFSRTSNGGVDLATPLYLNLAPNYDATLTPRFINNRGMLYEMETRYLGPAGEWTLGGAHINDDDAFNDRDRWLFALQQQAHWDSGWRTRVDYTAVSDDEYLRDLSTTSVDVRRKSHLDKTASVDYLGDTWTYNLTLQDYQTINPDKAEPYAELPHMVLSLNNPGEPFTLQPLLLADYVFFDDDERIRGHRLYSEAGVTYPMTGSAGFFTPTLKVRHVQYDLPDSNASNLDDAGFKERPAGSIVTGSASTTVPLFSLDTGLVFERSLSFNDTPWTQTLEPRLYYLYADYEEQDTLPNFDTSNLTFSYQQLFRETRFNGYDRLDDAHQASLGLTTRFLNNRTGREVFTAAVGQIFYFKEPRVSARPGQPYYRQTSSEIAAQIRYQPTPRFGIAGDINWNPHTDYTEDGGLALQWQPTSRSLFHLGYRYRREAPQTNPDTGELENQDIDQAEAATVVPLTDRWRLMAKMHYDMTHNLTLESLFGVEYNSCCWSLRLVYQEAIEGATLTPGTNFVFDEDLDKDYAFYLQFQLRGLGNLADDVEKLLSRSIPGFSSLDR